MVAVGVVVAVAVGVGVGVGVAVGVVVGVVVVVVVVLNQACPNNGPKPRRIKCVEKYLMQSSFAARLAA